MNTTRHMITVATASLLLATGVHGEPLITSITTGGSLTWSNYLPNATYRVEWATSVDGPWNTNPPSWVVSSTSHLTTVDIPMFYRVVWLDPPDIRYRTVKESPNMLGATELDLNEDGETDFRIQRIWLTNGHTTSEQVSIRAFRILASPFSYGDLIGPDTSWGTENQAVGIGGRNGFGYLEWGPWAGVTNAYIPLGFMIDTNIHYGWIRMEQSEFPILYEGTGQTSEFTYVTSGLVEAAWHTIPDTPIYAGQLE